MRALARTLTPFLALLMAAPIAAKQPPVWQEASPVNMPLAASNGNFTKPSGYLIRPARLQVAGVPLSKALAELQNSSGVPLAYSPKLLEGVGLVTCSCADVPLEAAIRTLLPAMDLEILQVGKHVVIRTSDGSASDPPSVELALSINNSGADLTTSAMNTFAYVEGPVAGVIRGIVTAQGTPLANVQVSVPQHGIGTLSGADGRYELRNIPSGTVTVRAQFLGYTTREQTVAVQDGASIVADFRMAVEVIGIDELVVTGTAGSRLRRAQGAQVASVNASEIREIASVRTVDEILQARSAGVMVQGGDGQAGTATRIRIRGNSSISLSNSPLVFIDGVRADSRNQVERPDQMNLTPGSFSGGDLGGQTRSRLGDINPEDIERIEIVKGPAAATLYGSEANAGVIQIFTKRGRSGGFTQTLNFEYGVSQPNFTPLSNWAKCKQTDINNGVPLCQSKQVGDLITDTPILREGYLRDANLSSFNWSGTGGNDFVQYYLSAGLDDENGVLVTNRYRRKFARANFHLQVNPKLNIKTAFGLTYTDENISQGNHSIQMLGASYTGDPLTVGMGFQDGWGFRPGPVTLKNERGDEVQRTTASVEAVYSPTDWLTNRVTLGTDFSNSDFYRFYPRNNEGWWSVAFNAGGLQVTRQRYATHTFDYLGNAKLRILPAQWQTNLSFGAQAVITPQEVLWAQGLGYTSNTTKTITAATEKSSASWEQEERSLGFFGQLELGFANRAFLQIGARADQHSAFGDEAPLFILPKVGASWVVSEENFFRANHPKWLSTLRLRGAYGTTGRAPPAGAALRTFTSVPYIDQVTGTPTPGVAMASPGNPDLAAERGKELEAGVDLGLFDGRLGLEMTFFNKVTTDLLLLKPVPVSTGTTQGQWDNIGKVLNRGFEVMVTAGLVTSDAFDWSVQSSMSTLHNELVDLGGVGAFAGRWDQWFKEGYPLGSAWTRAVKRFDLPNNRAIVSDTAEYQGHTLPSFSGTLSSTFAFRKNVNLAAHFEWRTGFKILNAGQAVQYAYSRRREFVDSTYLSKEDFLRRYGPFVTEAGQTVAQGDAEAVFWEPGDFLRFRELTLSYTLPSNFTRQLRVSRATVTLGARNLAVWTRYSGPDPESIANNAGIGDQFSVYDFFNLPTPRRFVAGLRVQF